LDNAAADKAIMDLKRQFEDVRGERRTNWEQHWQEIAEYVQPRKVDFVGYRTEGEKRMQRVYDSTAIHSNQLLAAALHGLATNPAAKWFSLRMTDDAYNEDDEIKSYLSNVEDIMWAKLYAPGTNFATSLHETYLDLASFGTAVMFVGETRQGQILTDARPLAECFIAHNEERVVDKLFRRTEYSVGQLMMLAKHRGWELSYRIQDKINNKKFEDKVWVIHAVYPREFRDPNVKAPSQMPYGSCYFEEDGLHKLSESGFPEFPYLVPRWSLYAGETYGRSPAMEALPDIKMLNSMMLAMIKALQKAIDPPLWLPDEGYQGPVRTIPGGINYYRGDRQIQQHPVSLQGIQFVNEAMEGIRDRIRQSFYVDVVQTYQSSREQTAYEVEQRQQERMRLMGPLVGRLEGELLGRLIDRVYGMLNRKQELPEPPENAGDQQFTVEYVSPLANVQKQSSMRGINQVLGMFAQMNEPGLAVIDRNTDLDKLYRKLWFEVWNNDPDVLRPDDELEERQQQEAQMRQMQAMKPGVEMAAQGADAMATMANAAQSGGVDLQALMGAAPQAAADPNVQGQVGAIAEQMNIDPAQIQELVGGMAGANAA